MKEDIIVVNNLKKDYVTGDVVTHAIKGVSFKIFKGEFVGIMGPSGSGKSTLLHMMGLLDEPSDGDIIIKGVSTRTLSSAQKTEWRLKNLGYVFQHYRLLPELNALENVYLPALMNEHPSYSDARSLLKKVGLSQRMTHYSSQLSGGEQQRVAIARGLINKPSILFADEPTANLDSNTGDQILGLFKELNKSMKQTIVMVSHEREHVRFFDRVIKVRDGVLE